MERKREGRWFDDQEDFPMTPKKKSLEDYKREMEKLLLELYDSGIAVGESGGEEKIYRPFVEKMANMMEVDLSDMRQKGPEDYNSVHEIIHELHNEFINLQRAVVDIEGAYKLNISATKIAIKAGMVAAYMSEDWPEWNVHAEK